MKTINLNVNGKQVSATVEPRLNLADFLRDGRMLTGTHVGCEHGVCGACTVELDGAPARSCIAFAAACDGATVRTIEGLDADPVMVQLREAFSAEHALQCGYCTPGMMVTARDIVMRLPQADEALIRKELSGNLCWRSASSSGRRRRAARQAAAKIEGQQRQPDRGHKEQRRRSHLVDHHRAQPYAQRLPAEQAQRKQGHGRAA